MLGRYCCAIMLVLLSLLESANAQSSGPGFRNGNPVSARISDTSRTDPVGLTALLNGLGFPSAYLGKWSYQFPLELVAADPELDPAVATPITGNNPAINGSFRVVGNTGVPAAHAQPFANNLALFIIRPNLQLNAGPSTNLQTYGNPQNYTGSWDRYDYNTIYNMTDNTFEPFYIKELAFCGGNTLLPDGRGFIVGGIIYGADAPYSAVGAHSVRIFDPAHRNYSEVAVMSSLRWYPTVMTLPDGNMLILGGAQAETGSWGIDQSPSSSMTSGPTNCAPNQGGGYSDPHLNNPTYQLYYPGNNTLSTALALTILLESWPVNTYPFATVLPSGSTLVVAGAQMQALFLGYEEAFEDEEVGDLPELPVPVTYPQSSSLALLPLQGPEYQAEILIAGGSTEYCANGKTPASQQTFLVDVSVGANHTLITEQANFPRVMPDLTIMADGRLFLCNGAGVGVSGGTGPNYSNADQAVTVAEIYDPSKPIGSRWSPVADGQIWRMYHSTAFLTQNAEIFVAGSETTGEFRAQLYTPDYLQNGKPRPVISGAPASINYAQSFSFQFNNVPSLDRVVFHRLAGATHGNHMDQRQVVLDCTPTTRETSCTSPPDGNIAPPGTYFLFASYQGVPSVAEYVSLGVTATSSA